ncbi:mitochondrial 54S ribosomal protein bL19m KNAG_0I02480 [Huiozyma naganishii CBS 8797]|uniref:Ribosomal protein L19 n=1 Tax=Huiozyma naganishii (strain ATCC MYA-139 / BCRC 22969 / CBS 8797 / KCTC 17520 / NBRC 10181 / NCYC 3082 / Yp74L-3) TaxID=1071383 RepID=J7S9D7_HUIN7|nr:hypothetical protein KNAG_0I02480 [Kazachstania naganishii CBS 8797]CCK72034.1 hypothetical protein KNAG_0I02480 [Kazachstania naganishii CBS 8797]
MSTMTGRLCVSQAMQRGAMVFARRWYQVPVSRRKMIPVYPPLEKPPLKRGPLLRKVSMLELDSTLDRDRWRRSLLAKRARNDAPQQQQATPTVAVGDVVRVVYNRAKCAFDPFVGYVLGVNRKRVVQDASLLLRNAVAKTVVETRVPIFSPLVERIEVLKKSDGKRARNKHYYIRGTKLDVNNLEARLRKKK